MVKFYLNLTNGIEALEKQGFRDGGFIRIQSTACEQGRWDFILQELDYNFLMDIALGNVVMVIDFGANKDYSRALYQGVVFIEYVLNRRWLNIVTEPVVRGHNCSKYFDECYRKLEKRTLKKLDYFKKFLRADEIKILKVGASTDKDGDYEYYKDLLWRVK